MAIVQLNYGHRKTLEQSVFMYVDRLLPAPRVLLLVCVCGFAWIWIQRTDVAAFVEKRLADSLAVDQNTGCEIPYLDPFSKEAIEFDIVLPSLTCEPQDWVKCYRSNCRILDEVFDKVWDVRCQFRDILYKTDTAYELGPVTEILKGDVYKLVLSDHVNVFCLGTDIKSGDAAIWFANTLGLRPVTPKRPPPGRKDSPSGVVFILDSVSKSAFIRLMPESWKVLTKELGATVMNGFNVVGDGPPFALLPILTGRTELELPDVRKRTLGQVQLEHLPFIFYHLQEYGYRTAYFEDLPTEGTFQSRYKGFRRQPTDHYLRSFWLANSPLHKGKNWSYCLGDTPQYKVMMNITEQFLEMEGKGFVVTFIADLTHERLDHLQWADAEMASFLRRLASSNDTLIVVMGDHGPRYPWIRNKNSIYGKLDERLPLLALRLPGRLRARRQRALEHNARALVTVHDLHATLLDVLGMRQHWNLYKVPGADLTRGLTLLKQIPYNRSCSEAGIERHWCSCLLWQSVLHTDPLYKKSAETLIDYINWLVKAAGPHQCVPRNLKSIRWVLRQKTNNDLDTTKVANLNATQAYGTLSTEYFMIAIVAGPDDAMYEAPLTYHVIDDDFMVVATDILRTNAYESDSKCILESHPYLAPFCYCQR